jgi:hypothetical protein
VSTKIPVIRPGGVPHIPGYEIEKELGRGTSGVVYRARQLSVDRCVALKVMHPDMLANARSVKRLQREARIAAHLAHPNLISAIDMGQSGGYWWFAMELVEGPSLAERLQNGGRLREGDALVMFGQLCGALQHASEKGVVHRDIKPANILLERPDLPRLVDLGLARIEDDPMLTRTGSTLGTPHYVSPEQARDPALADVRSDIWSLGATMYHAVCGQPPFSGSSTAEILSSVLYGAIPDPGELRPELSRGLVLVLRKCLSRDPNRRYFAPAELEEDLERVRAHKAPQIRRGALEPLDPTRRESRNRGFIVATIVLLFCGGLLALWRPWAESTRNDQDLAQVESEGPWQPLERLETDLDAGRLSLAAAFAELEALGRRVPDARRVDWERSRSKVRGRLREVLMDLRLSVQVELGSLIEERDFDAAQELLGEALSTRLIDATGFEQSILPREHRGILESRRGTWLRELADRRRAALTGAVTRIEGYARNQFLPSVERQLDAGEWSAARLTLSSDLRQLCEEADCDLRGLGEGELHAALSSVQDELEARRTQLEEQWRALERDVLAEVERLALFAEDKLEAGGGPDVLTEFDEGFDALLTRYRLTREELMRGPLHTSYDAYQSRRNELRDLEDAHAQTMGMARLEELDAQAWELYAARDYESAVAFWETHATEQALEVVSDTVAVRLEEAQELLGLLLRAADGVERLAGSEVSMRQGSITVSGRVELRGKVFERGFRLMTRSGNPLIYLLRPTSDAEGEVLAADTLERFATEGSDPSADIGLQLKRALFRYHEGDYEGANALLRTEALQGGDLILYDLGLRVATQLGRSQDIEARRRLHAQEQMQRLVGRDAVTLDPDLRSVEIGRLLRKYGDVLSESASEALRKTRIALERELPPSTVEDFRAAFGADEVRFPRFGRVAMRFSFDAGEVGSWSRGDWFFDGNQAWTCAAAVDLAQLVARDAPTLHLGDPLMVDGESLVFELHLYQPEDSPPDLFVISALGFHVAFAGPRGPGPARVLSDTQDLVEVCRRVRGGEGEAFAGLTADTEHRILLRLSRGSGKLVIEVDGERVGGGHHRPRRRVPGELEISFRSIEPVEVMQLTVEGDRR